MLRVSDAADDENRTTCWPIPVAGPMRHDGEVLSAQFSALELSGSVPATIVNRPDCF
jgi:hypothetical protein